MSWGTDLWDQYESIAAHTQRGIEFLDRSGKFIKERCDIESEYANKLKRLVKSYQPKKKAEDDDEFTSTRGFQMMLKEVHDLAGQHDQIVENLQNNVIKEINSLVSELKKSRKEHLQEANKLNYQLQNQLQQLDRVKKKYEKSYGESEKATESYKKAEEDINLSRAEVEKTKNVMMQKIQHCDSCKTEYASELQKTNQCQTEHFTSTYPKALQELQNLEQKRLEKLKYFIMQLADTERSVVPIVNTCIDGIVRASNSINPEEDIRIAIEKYKSGFPPPGDLPFEDLGHTNGDDNQSNQSTPKPQRPDHVKGTMNSGRTKKRTKIFNIFSGSKTDDVKEDYSHLPPNQQKKNLLTKIEEVRQAIAKESNGRDALLKMQDVYRQNTKLGDPSSLDNQLDENAQKLDKLNADLHKWETYLQAAEARTNSLDPNGSMRDLSITSSHSNPSTPNAARTSKFQQQPDDGATSISSSSPDVRLLTYQNVPNNLVNNSTLVKNVTLDKTRSPQSQLNDSNDSFDDENEDEFTVIGECTALYAFPANSEGSIPMSEGEVFKVVESDQGDGWTRVRKSNGDEGFVPTSYVSLKLY